jgi:hypothetical protein
LHVLFELCLVHCFACRDNGTGNWVSPSYKGPRCLPSSVICICICPLACVMHSAGISVEPGEEVHVPQAIRYKYRYRYRLQNSVGIKGPCDWGGTQSLVQTVNGAVSRSQLAWCQEIAVHDDTVVAARQ